MSVFSLYKKAVDWPPVAMQTFSRSLTVKTISVSEEMKNHNNLKFLYRDQ